MIRRMMLGILVSFSVVWASVGTNAFATDWPTYRFDRERSGGTVEQLSLPLANRWTIAAPATPQTAWSGPDKRVIEGKHLRHRVTFDDAFHVAVVRNRVYYGSTVDHQVHCVDSANGKEIWRFFTGGPVRLAPSIVNGRAYFGSDDGYAYCVDAKTGKEIWKLRAGPSEEALLARGEMISRWPIRTGVLVDDGVAYFGAGIFPSETVYVYAVSADDGQIVWKRGNISQESAERNDLSPQGYLLASDENLFVPSGRSLPAAMSRDAGRLIHKAAHGWRSTAGGVVGGSKAVLGDGQLYSGGDHHFLALNQKTGGAGFAWLEGRQLAIAGEAAYLATEKDLFRVDRLKYAQATKTKHDLEMKIYSLNRNLRSAKGDKADEIRQQIKDAQAKLPSLKDVGIVWRVPASAESAVIAAGNLVFAGSQDVVTAFNAEDGKVAWTAKVDGDARGLAVAAGSLYVSTTTGAIHCFGGKSDSVAKATKWVEDPFPQDALTPVYAAAAKEILARTKADRGFCLVLGSEQGRLAYELARRTNLKIYGLEPDAKKVEQSRKLLASAGLYGNRVVIHHAELSQVPYSSYFANLVVSDSLIVSGEIKARPGDVVRHLKPLGGVVCLGRPSGAPGTAPKQSELQNWLKDLKLDENGAIAQGEGYAMLTRGKLPGAGNWSHQYGDAGNTATSDDRLVGGGLGILWYGDPGPGKMVNRHDGAVGPLAVDGRLIVQGEDSVMAYDSYNGQFLWELKNPEAIRTGVFQNQNPGNLVAGGSFVFVMVRGKCLKIDVATGKLLATYETPSTKSDETHEWGYLAYKDGILVGTATVRGELESKFRRRGRRTNDVTDAIFAIDTRTDKVLWTYNGKTIAHHTVAVGDDQVFFIDSTITSAQREELLREDKTELKKLTGDAAKAAEERMKNIDARTAVGLDLRTGKKKWDTVVDVTDCSEIGIGGGKLTLLYHNNVLLLCGANANGHYWQQFMSGEFKKRRLVALTADNGQKLWARDANYRNRPIIVEDQVIAEPWGYDLYTGTQRMREHPLTGKQEPWSIMRSGHHCGMISAAPNMLMFRSGFTSFYDLKSDTGTSHIAGHRTGCWINMIPANGLVMVPESSAGCVCLFSIASTIVLEPRPERTPWAIYSSVGAVTPVKHMALNLGAPGDRRDQHGTIWLAYPRPRPSRATSLNLPLDLKAKFASKGGFQAQNADAPPVGNSENPWLFASTGEGLTQLTLPLLGKGDAEATYTVTLHFADADESAQAGERVFNVVMQGKTVLENLDVAAAAGGSNKALVREVANVKVTSDLVIDLVPSSKESGKTPPTLNAIEVLRTDAGKTGEGS